MNNRRNNATISAAALSEALQGPSPPRVIDVRSALEYRSGHIPGARHLPFWRAWAASLAPNEPLVLYCEHGPRAALAGMLLRRKVTAPLQLLQGHMQGWRRAGLPIEKGTS